ncbi:MAG: flavin reductase family protein [Pseudomonadota bacterium]|nr:flavin reductase family protein [Pseudomonadota bacterium]
MQKSPPSVVPDLADRDPEPVAPVDSRYFRQALSQFATGVTVVTMVGADGKLVGLTATSFNSVSLQPPLVLWSLGQSASSLAAFSAGAHYVINVLAADQVDLARRFGTRVQDRFEGVALDLSATGQPILHGAVAWFECANRSRYPEGDHVIFVGEVVQCAFSQRPPLLFHASQFATTAPLPSR